jgi:hypothetical protein
MERSLNLLTLFVPLIVALAAIAFVNDLFYIHNIVGAIWGFIIGGLIRSVVME